MGAPRERTSPDRELRSAIGPRLRRSCAARRYLADQVPQLSVLNHCPSDNVTMTFDEATSFSTMFSSVFPFGGPFRISQ
jgi:hypothetical protein